MNGEVAMRERIERLPDLVRPLFHNYRVESIDVVRDSAWVILTVLSRGDWEQVRWLFSRYGWKGVEVAVFDDIEGSQTLPRVVANFWSLVFWDRPLRPRTAIERWAPTRRLPAAGRSEAEPVR